MIESWNRAAAEMFDNAAKFTPEGSAHSDGPGSGATFRLTLPLMADDSSGA